ncbi:sodium-dependent transporter [Kordiimonas sp. SCSIO 12610]|uniref:sodium-dependent transporter n=1 Tax=Kordiimonas sp. SCSIO 12610 TaxID=2829597 RepID=UPI002109FCC3|nr:sodium-dependent transporter [Kordiimonas sp. SCSIO 12610]UTW54483.1 sodium-dependent transporter [Kordiimonas sp. SCSIO 12610]
MAGTSKELPNFTSRIAFILVTAGAAVGLGNVWGFPYVAGKNGGGGFMLIYLLALTFVATPVLMAELLLGRMGRASPPTAMRKLQLEARRPEPWSVIMWAGLVGSILILSFYSVIAGQALFYGFEAMVESFHGWTSEEIIAFDAGYKSDIVLMAFWSAVFVGLTALIVSADVTKGIELAGKWLTPVLFVLLVIIVVYSSIYGDMPAALNFLFGFDHLVLTPGVFLEAVGQAFFTISVGVGGIMMYGAYMGNNVNLPKAVTWIVLMDLGVAILAGLAIFPLVFGEGVDAAAGPGLIFITLPIVFAKITGGGIISVLFFVLLAFAAITSSISLLSPTVARLEEAGWKRAHAAWVMSIIAFFLSFLTVLSFNEWSEFYPLAFLGFDGLTAFSLIREGVSNILLPLVGVACAIIVGWRIKKERIMAALPMQETKLFQVWYFCLRFIVPMAITALFINAVFGG